MKKVDKHTNFSNHQKIIENKYSLGRNLKNKINFACKNHTANTSISKYTDTSLKLLYDNNKVNSLFSETYINNQNLNKTTKHNERIQLVSNNISKNKFNNNIINHNNYIGNNVLYESHDINKINKKSKITKICSINSTKDDNVNNNLKENQNLNLLRNSFKYQKMKNLINERVSTPSNFEHIKMKYQTNFIKKTVNNSKNKHCQNNNPINSTSLNTNHLNFQNLASAFCNSKNNNLYNSNCLYKNNNETYSNEINENLKFENHDKNNNNLNKNTKLNNKSFNVNLYTDFGNLEKMNNYEKINSSNMFYNDTSPNDFYSDNFKKLSSSYNYRKINNVKNKKNFNTKINQNLTKNNSINFLSITKSTTGENRNDSLYHNITNNQIINNSYISNNNVTKNNNLKFNQIKNNVFNTKGRNLHLKRDFLTKNISTLNSTSTNNFHNLTNQINSTFIKTNLINNQNNFQNKYNNRNIANKSSVILRNEEDENNYQNTLKNLNTCESNSNIKSLDNIEYSNLPLHTIANMNINEEIGNYDMENTENLKNALIYSCKNSNQITISEENQNLTPKIYLNNGINENFEITERSNDKIYKIKKLINSLYEESSNKNAVMVELEIFYKKILENHSIENFNKILSTDDEIDFNNIKHDKFDYFEKENTQSINNGKNQNDNNFILFTENLNSKIKKIELNNTNKTSYINNSKLDYLKDIENNKNENKTSRKNSKNDVKKIINNNRLSENNNSNNHKLEYLITNPDNSRIISKNTKNRNETIKINNENLINENIILKNKLSEYEKKLEEKNKYLSNKEIEVFNITMNSEKNDQDNIQKLNKINLLEFEKLQEVLKNAEIRMQELKNMQLQLNENINTNKLKSLKNSNSNSITNSNNNLINKNNINLDEINGSLINNYYNPNNLSIDEIVTPSTNNLSTNSKIIGRNNNFIHQDLNNMKNKMNISESALTFSINDEDKFDISLDNSNIMYSNLQTKNDRATGKVMNIPNLQIKNNSYTINNLQLNNLTEAKSDKNAKKNYDNNKRKSESKNKVI